MKRMRVPYFKQDTSYTCGPTSLQMVLAYYGVRASEHHLAQLMHANQDVGTLHSKMIETVQEYGLHCYVNNLSTMEEIQYLLKYKVPVIVRFVEPEGDEDHYGVVVGYNRFFITIHDPWNGPSQRYLHTTFKERWRCDKLGVCKHWLMAVSKDPLPTGHQYHPHISIL